MRKKNKIVHKTPLWTIFFVIGCTIIIGVAQVMLKYAVQMPGSIIMQPLLWLSMIMSFISGILLMFALKHGELSVLYPFISLGFVWVTLESIFLLHEQTKIIHIIGIIIIIIGVAIIGHSGIKKQKKKEKNAKRNSINKKHDKKYYEKAPKKGVR